MNVFGERQHPEKFIPIVIKNVKNNKTVVVHSDKTKSIPGSRHYIHADDERRMFIFIKNHKKIEKLKDYGGAKCPKFNLVGPIELIWSLQKK